jgi:hypothetical protein
MSPGVKWNTAIPDGHFMITAMQGPHPPVPIIVLDGNPNQLLVPPPGPTGGAPAGGFNPGIGEIRAGFKVGSQKQTLNPHQVFAFGFVPAFFFGPGNLGGVGGFGGGGSSSPEGSTRFTGLLVT